MYFLVGAAIVALFIALFKLFLGRRRKTVNSDDSNNDTLQQSDSASTFGDSGSVPLPIGEYEVFLNFRGPDTRDNITNILYRFLVLSKIRTFRDDDELRKGEGIWPSLVKAIGQSKISVPIFSPRYAESKWCLKELAAVVEHQKREKGHVILPIFYKIDPRDVRHQTGPYKTAFQQHKRSNKFDEDTIQSWKVALNEVGSLKGWHIKTEKEAVDVADVISGVVWSHLIKNNSTLEIDELVGIDDHMKQVVDMLDLGAKGVNLIGIHGMGGIGKTTLATAVYNKVSTCFDRYSFVKDIRETQKQTKDVLVLQKKLLSDILSMESVGPKAKEIIRERVTQFKILVVLDDVDEKFNFEEVLGNSKSFAPGSCFIITSRDIKVLERLTGDKSKLYEVKKMDDSHSLQLFYKHAFREDPVSSDLDDLSKSIVSKAGGLPLALKVIGSLLWREEKVFWKAKLEQLQEMPDEDVMDRLMISYTALTEEAQQIFLDIACFYIGENKEKASYMWSDCKYHPAINVKILIQRSMLKIGDRNEFQMHDQFRDMGREIVRKEDTDHPERRSRIWVENEGKEILLDNKGTNQVRALRGGRALRIIFYPRSKSVESGCFRKMTELMKCKATNFNMKNMVIFEANTYGIDDIPTVKEAKKLKFLKLGNCRKMSKLPELPESLEMLHLSKFDNKKEDMELGNLHNLKVVSLKSCTLGRFNGGTFGMMKELRELKLTHIKCDFDSFRRVIANVGQLSSLEILEFNSPKLKDVLEGIKLPKSLKVLETSSCFDNLPELLDLEEFSIIKNDARTSMVEGQNTVLPSSLTTVVIFHLQSHTFLNLTNLSNLTQLKLWGRPYLQEIQGLGGLKSLQILSIGKMEKLAHIEGLGILMSSSYCKLTHVEIIECPLLRALQTFEQHDDEDDTNDAVQIESLIKLEIVKCPLMDCRSIPKLSEFPKLNVLTIRDIGSNVNDESTSQQDQLLEGLDNLGELVQLQVRHLAKVQRLPSLSKLSKLTKLTLYDLPCLREIVGLGNLKSLKELEVSVCISLERMLVEDLTKLKKLSLSDLPRLREIVGLGDLKSLKELEVSDCISLERMLVEDLTKLTVLIVSGLPCLQEIVGLGALKSLQGLAVRRCISLERMPVEGLSYSTMFYIDLDLTGCTKFTNAHSDLSPLTTQRAFYPRRLEVNIIWPEEHLGPFQRGSRPPSEESDDDTWEESDDNMGEESDDDL